MGRWRGEAGRREAGAAVRRGLRRGPPAAARSSPRPWPGRGCSDAGKDRRSASRLWAGSSGRASSGAAAVPFLLLLRLIPSPPLSSRSLLLSIPFSRLRPVLASRRHPAPGRVRSARPSSSASRAAPFPSGGAGGEVISGLQACRPPDPARKVLDTRPAPPPLFRF